MRKPVSAGTADVAAGFSALPIGRVAVNSVDVHTEPDAGSPLVFTLRKDTLVQILGTVESEGPEGNPRWVKVEAGYLHSGDIQPVRYHPQIPLERIDRITPAEVSVPIAQSYRTVDPVEQILYRLYYQSVHWVKGVKIGPRERIWYILYDRQLGREYFVGGDNLRLLAPEGYSPIATEIDPWKKRIEIELSAQTLTAFEDAEVVRESKVSSGLPGPAHTRTPTGTFHIQIKTACVHMGDGRLTTDPLAYELPGVPWVGYFEIENGVALHGAYWHNDFGRPRSHGCVNLYPEDALWLYRWSAPSAAEATVQGTGGLGTRVIIR
jgi:hypothetical protein